MPVDVPAGATRSAVLALVPEAEPVVGELRARLDPTAAAGVPAHITVLYPFAPPSTIDDGTVSALRAAVAGAAPFSFRLDDVGWFGDDYVWLAPTPVTAFDVLTARVHRAFPRYPPYSGEHEPHPHLTVGYLRRSSVEERRARSARSCRSRRGWIGCTCWPAHPSRTRGGSSRSSRSPADDASHHRQATPTHERPARTVDAHERHIRSTGDRAEPLTRRAVRSAGRRRGSRRATRVATARSRRTSPRPRCVEVRCAA